MKYKSVPLNVVAGSLAIWYPKKQVTQHYDGTNVSEVYELGKEAVKITATLIARSEEQRILYESLLRGQGEGLLKFTRFYFKKVVTGPDCSPKAQTGDEDTWHIDATFYALDPVPYDITTEGAQY